MSVPLITKSAVDSPGREDEGALVRAIAAAPQSIAMFDRRMRYLAASARWYSDYKLMHRDVVGMSHYEVFPEIPERWKEFHRRGIAGETIHAAQDLFARTDGGLHWLNWTIRPWETDTGEVGGILISTEDMTAERRLQIESELATSERDALLEQGAMGVVVLDSSGQVLRANAAACTSLRRTAADAVGSAFGEWLHSADRTELLDQIAKLRKGCNTGLAGRSRVERPDGTLVWMSYCASLLPSHSAESAKVLLFLDDITERIALEQRVRESDRLASIGMLGAGLGHDMNNVLLPLRAHANVVAAALRQLEHADSATESMRSLRQGLAYLQQLADGMHFLATNETTSDGTPAAVGSTDLVEWWTTVEPLLRSVVPTRAVFEASFAPRLPEIGMSSSSLTQVMLNLLVNSADALEQRHGKRASGGSLLISFSTELRSRRRFVRVCVSDNGSGMSEEVRLRACEPFYTTKPRGRGTGLGLAVIQRAMDEVEGAVEIESTLGEGTWISLRVPARRAE